MLLGKRNSQPLRLGYKFMAGIGLITWGEEGLATKQWILIFNQLNLWLSSHASTIRIVPDE